MSGAAYIKGPYGPMPSQGMMLRAITHLAEEDSLEVQDDPDPKNIRISIDPHAEIIKPPPRPGPLNGAAHLDRIRHFCKKLGGMSVKKLSELSRDSVYDMHEMGEAINMDGYLISETMPLTDEDIAWAKDAWAEIRSGRRRSGRRPFGRRSDLFVLTKARGSLFEAALAIKSGLAINYPRGEARAAKVNVYEFCCQRQSETR